MPKNNEIIDHPDYYRLPDGRDLEDYIADAKLDFAHGSALKYLWRAGRKDGESREKDINKAIHYAKFIASRCGCTHRLILHELRARIRFLGGCPPCELDTMLPQMPQ